MRKQDKTVHLYKSDWLPLLVEFEQALTEAMSGILPVRDGAVYMDISPMPEAAESFVSFRVTRIGTGDDYERTMLVMLFPSIPELFKKPPAPMRVIYRVRPNQSAEHPADIVHDYAVPASLDRAPELRLNYNTELAQLLARGCVVPFFNTGIPPERSAVQKHLHKFFDLSKGNLKQVVKYYGLVLSDDPVTVAETAPLDNITVQHLTTAHRALDVALTEIKKPSREYRAVMMAQQKTAEAAALMRQAQGLAQEAEALMRVVNLS